MRPALVVLLALAGTGSAAAQQASLSLSPDSSTLTSVEQHGAVDPDYAPPTPSPVRHPRGGWYLAPVFGDSADHLTHNTINILVSSTALVGFLWSLPEDFPNFNTIDPSWQTFREAYTKPPLWNDGDWWVWNYIAHPAVGMQQYLMERNWGSSQRRAFLFSAVSSLAWEYGFEAWMERPSVQDMLLTAPVGWVLGEASYRLTQELRRNGFSTPERLVVMLTNPLYVLQHGFN